MRGIVLFSVPVTLWLTSVGSVYGETSERQSIDAVIAQLSALVDYQEVVISPDSRTVAWAQGVPETNSTSTRSAVFVAPADGRGRPYPIKVTQAGAGTLIGTQHDLAWSPDSKSLAFLADREKLGQLQLYVMREGGIATRLTNLDGLVATPRWSPDGKRIAILYTPGATRAAGPFAATPPELGVVGEHIDEQRLATVDVATGSVTLLTPEDLYVYEYDWSPNGAEVVATAAHGPGDNGWYSAELIAVDAATGATRSLYKPSSQIAVPRWSPDGKSIAFIAGLNSDEPIACGEIFRLPASGGAVENLTPNLKGSAYWLSWRPDSKSILFVDAIDGATGVAEVSTTPRGGVHLLWTRAEMLTGPANIARGLSVARDGRTTAVIRSSFDHPSQIESGPAGTWHTVAKAQPVSQPMWGKAESVTWQCDEFTVQGWLLYPRNYDPQRKYPMVVWVHGGPAWLTTPEWPTVGGWFHFLDTVVASQGYMVFYPNPRGSAGFGEAFKRAMVRDQGGGDLRDILAGVKHVVATRTIDDTRVGIGGWSYGGDMTMWALTQTTRFRAGFAGSATADLMAYYAENDFNAYLLLYFGASPYDDPQVYAKSSPINFVKNVRTPALIVVGASDEESPVLQSREYWNALKSFHVKTQLVVYPDEGHKFHDPAHIKDVAHRLVGWLDDNMGDASVPLH
jgi:dipeptidyl aminopeptidase/acylaminoacyl peptidase